MISTRHDAAHFRGKNRIVNGFAACGIHCDAEFLVVDEF
jgi:hypothetical protein